MSTNRSLALPGVSARGAGVPGGDRSVSATGEVDAAGYRTDRMPAGNRLTRRSLNLGGAGGSRPLSIVVAVGFLVLQVWAAPTVSPSNDTYHYAGTALRILGESGQTAQ